MTLDFIVFVGWVEERNPTYKREESKEKREAADS
jgi:hypothetical protein